MDKSPEFKKGGAPSSEYHPRTDYASPLEAVLNRPVALSHLLQLHAAPPDAATSPHPILSSYMRDVLLAAAAARRTDDAAAAPFVLRLGDIFQTMIGLRRTPPYDTFGPFYEALDGLADHEPHATADDPRATDADLEEVFLAEDVTTILIFACRLSLVLRKERTAMIGLRHFTLALLQRVEGREMLWWDGHVSGAPDDALGALAGALGACLERAFFLGDFPEGWADQLRAAAAADPEPRLPAPLQVSDDRYVPDLPLQRLDQDQLGDADGVRALARVVAMRSTTPPLAVGLFGEWGSGKSSFMNMLMDAVDQLTVTAAASDAARDLFVRNVAHIRFNAWTYNETDLWSSMTSEIFGQLRNGGYDGRNAVLLRNVMEQVSEFVSTARASLGDAEISLAAKRSERDRIAGALATAEREHPVDRAEILAEAAGAAVEALDAATVRAALKAIGADPPATKEGEAATTQALKTEIENAAGFAGQASVFGSALIRALGFSGPSWWKVWGMILAGLAICFVTPWSAGAAFVAERLGFGYDGGGAGVVAQAVAAIAAAALPLAHVYRTVEPIFRARRAFLRSYAEKRKAADDELATLRKNLADAEAEVGELARARDAAETQAKRFREDDPADVLAYFLQQSDETRSFEANLGVVSKVERVFAKLESIIESTREAGGETIDRIILYIDDLDRCRAETVVSVLEAVHLLLAKKLFVVVVGVDPRWLARALSTKLNLSPGEDDAMRTATPKDYLEKIFQIPIRLGRLEAKKEAFGNYVSQISGPHMTEAAAKAETAPQPEPVNGVRMEIAPADVDIPPLEREATEEAKAVILQAHEIRMTQELGALLGRSPRAVKKFVNLYRLARGLRRGAELEAFLAPAKRGQANYAVIQFWLAADCGLSSEQMRALRELVRFTSRMDISLRDLFKISVPPAGSGGGGEGEDGAAPRGAPGGVKDPRDKEALDAVMAFWELIPMAHWDGIWEAFEALDRVLGAASNPGTLQSGAQEASRFSASL